MYTYDEREQNREPPKSNSRNTKHIQASEIEQEQADSMLKMRLFWCFLLARGIDMQLVFSSAAFFFCVTLFYPAYSTPFYSLSASVCLAPAYLLYYLTALLLPISLFGSLSLFQLHPFSSMQWTKFIVTDRWHSSFLVVTSI